MARVTTLLPASARIAESARIILVTACAAALILAGEALPFLN